MTISKTIGSGGDFSTINAWVSWVQSNAVSGGNLTDNVVANILQSGISPTASDTVSGWAPGGSNYTTTIQANAGGGFKDNANAQTNALAFNTANGAYINYSGTSGTFLTISVNLCTVQYLQMKVAGQYKYAINFTSTLTSATVNANIFDATNGSNAVNLPTSNSAANVVVKNNAVFWDNTSRQGKMIIGNNYLAYNNTFGGTASGASAINCFATGGYPVGTVITNNLCVALTTNALIVPGNHYSHGITGSNNANTGASIMSTGTGATGTTGITGSNEVQNTASDLRLNKTSTVAKDGGATVASVTVDIVGTTRPQGSAYDIGCWELVQFNPAWAQSQGVIGDTAMYLKNTSGQYLGFGLINATNGSALTGATVTAYLSIDGGSQAAVTGSVSELGNGQYLLAMSQADTNGNDITFLFTATSAVPVEKTIVTSSPEEGSFGAPLTFFASATPKVPSNANSAYVRIWGGAGSGGIAVGATGSARGGATGGYSEGFIVTVPGETATITVGAGGASVTSSTSSAGNAGGTSSFAVASKTISCTGGAGGTFSNTNGVAPGTVAGGTASNGDLNVSGGTSGAPTTVTSEILASGGAGASSVYGVGASSGVPSGASNAATGGAGMQGASGNASTNLTATGGGGWFAASGSSTATATPSGGGGAVNPSLANSLAGGPGDTLETLIQNPIMSLSVPLGGGGAGTTSGAGGNGSSGGGGGASTGGAAVGGSGGFGGGGGGVVVHTGTVCTAGAGGLFGGGGGSVSPGSSIPGIGGAGGLAGGGGAGCGPAGQSCTSGAGGAGLVIVQWVYG